MERLRRLNEVWSWLPAFRAVAETEHLPSAAAKLRVGASALSRAVRLLEEGLGVRLFEREGRSLKLNPAGVTLLTALRRSMRDLDDAIDSTAGRTFVGPLRLSATSDLTILHLEPALRRLVATYPDLLPKLTLVSQREVAEQLLNGSLDVALDLQPASSRAVTSTRLGELAFGVFAHPRHPLARRRREALTAAQLGAYPFCDYVRTAIVVHPSWSVRLETQTVEQALRACAQGPYLLVGPDNLLGQVGGLVRLMRLPVQPVYAIYRHPVSTPNKLEELLSELRATMPTARARQPKT